MDASVELVKHLLASVVHIHAEVPAAHPSTRILGDERMGTGTVVDPAGLILTVNYVVMGGRDHPGHASARGGPCGPRSWPRTSSSGWPCCR